MIPWATTTIASFRVLSVTRLEKGMQMTGNETAHSSTHLWVGLGILAQGWILHDLDANDFPSMDLKSRSRKSGSFTIDGRVGPVAVRLELPGLCGRLFADPRRR